MSVFFPKWLNAPVRFMQSSEEAKGATVLHPPPTPVSVGSRAGERAGNLPARTSETVHTRFCWRETLCQWSQYLKHERRGMIWYGMIWWVCRSLLQPRRFESCIIACESQLGVRGRNCRGQLLFHCHRPKLWISNKRQVF